MISFPRFDTSVISSPPARKTRTPAQIEASRRNGAKSRGPKSAAGKRRSSRNALKHGLFAWKLRPGPDWFGHREYDHLVHELTAEFRPSTITGHNLVETLASDWVALCRLLAAREALMSSHLEGDTERSTIYPIDAAQDIATLERLLAQAAAGKRPRCDTSNATRLAGLIIHDCHEQLAWTKSLLCEPGDDEHDDEELELDLASSIARLPTDKLPKFLRTGLPIARLLSDSSALSQALAGKGHLSPDEDRALTGVLAALAEKVRQQLEDNEVLDGSRNRAHRYQRAIAVQDRLPKLESMRVYESHLRRLIAKTTAMLTAMRDGE